MVCNFQLYFQLEIDHKSYLLAFDVLIYAYVHGLSQLYVLCLYCHLSVMSLIIEVSIFSESIMSLYAFNFCLFICPSAS